MKIIKKLLVLLLLPLSIVSCSNGEVSSSISSNVNNNLIIAKLPNRVNYDIGDQFTSDGLTIKNYKNQLVEDYTLSLEEGYVFNTVGKYHITISKTNYNSVGFDINVGDTKKLVVKQLPRINYMVNDYFSSDGLVVTDNFDAPINNYTISISNGTKLRNIGTTNVYISKEGYYSTSYSIKVDSVISLYISKLPNNTSYTQGDYFDIAGLVIKDSSNNVVDDYDISLPNNTYFKYSGLKNIQISKDGYNGTSFSINVNESTSSYSSVDDLDMYYVNDTHGYYSYDSKNQNAGMTKIGGYLKNKKQEDPNNTLILSGGDMFEGGYECNMTYGQIMVDAMNYIGFDAMALGNHEFSWGEAKLADICNNLECPVVSANTFYKNMSRPDYISPYAILNKGNLKIGIIGAARENMGSSIEGSIANSFYFPNAVGYVKQHSEYLRNTELCDIILLLTHDEGKESGDAYTDYYACTAKDPSTNMPYVDAMFFAHDHKSKKGVENGVPYIEAGQYSESIGLLKLSLSSNGINYKVNSSSTEIKSALFECGAEDTYLANLPQTKYSDTIKNTADSVITYVSKTYSHYGEDENSVCYIICKAMMWYVNTHQDEFDGITVSLASHNTSGVRAELQEGYLTYREFYKVYPFVNSLYILQSNEYNISYTMSKYGTYPQNYDDVEFDQSGLTYAVSISYLAENSYYGKNMYTNNYCVEYSNITAQDAFLEYLKLGYC